jgi:hypothetical protein
MPAASAAVPVLPVASAPAVTTPPSQADRLEELGELLYPLVVAQLLLLRDGVSAGKIVGMLLDALKDDEDELTAIIGDCSFLISYMQECTRTLEEAAAASRALASSPPMPVATPAPAPIFSGPTPAEMRAAQAATLEARLAAQAETVQARRDAKAASSTLVAAAKKLESFATADALAVSIAAIISEQSGVTISREDIAALACRTAREALGLAATMKPP